MKCGMPAEMDTGTVEKIWRHINTKNLTKLEDMMIEDGLIVQMQESKKLALDALRALYFDNCCVYHPQDGRTHCSCWHFRRRAHCPHAWAIRAQLKLESFPSEDLPAATEAPLTWLDADGSSNEDVRKKAPPRSRKRKRPEYEPVAVPDDRPAPVTPVGERLPQRRTPKVLPAQKASKSPFGKR